MPARVCHLLRMSCCAGAVQAAVRTEVERSLEPVRRLPQMIAMSLPSALGTTSQPPAQESSAGLLLSAVQVQDLAEQLKSAVRQEVDRAVQLMLEKQVGALTSQLSSEVPVPNLALSAECGGRTCGSERAGPSRAAGPRAMGGPGSTAHKAGAARGSCPSGKATRSMQGRAVSMATQVWDHL